MIDIATYLVGVLIIFVAVMCLIPNGLWFLLGAFVIGKYIVKGIKNVGGNEKSIPPSNTNDPNGDD